MSYSFSVVASTKDEAKEKIAAQFAEIASQQPPHKLDEPAAVAAGSAFVDLLGDVPEGHEIHVSMYGSLSWMLGTSGCTSANLSVTANFRKVA